jgi:hypothetical protein
MMGEGCAAQGDHEDLAPPALGSCRGVSAVSPHASGMQQQRDPSLSMRTGWGVGPLPRPTISRPASRGRARRSRVGAVRGRSSRTSRDVREGGREAMSFFLAFFLGLFCQFLTKKLQDIYYAAVAGIHRPRHIYYAAVAGIPEISSRCLWQSQFITFTYRF